MRGTPMRPVDTSTRDRHTGKSSSLSIAWVGPEASPDLQMVEAVATRPEQQRLRRRRYAPRATRHTVVYAGSSTSWGSHATAVEVPNTRNSIAYTQEKPAERATESAISAPTAAVANPREATPQITPPQPQQPTTSLPATARGTEGAHGRAHRAESGFPKPPNNAPRAKHPNPRTPPNTNHRTTTKRHPRCGPTIGHPHARAITTPPSRRRTRKGRTPTPNTCKQYQIWRHAKWNWWTTRKSSSRTGRKNS